MIKAICDDPPPVAGGNFSKDFNQFVDACLRKEQGDRASAKQLLSKPFIEHNAASLKMSFSDLQMKKRRLHEIIEQASEKGPSSSSSGFGGAGAGAGMSSKESPTSSSPVHSGSHVYSATGGGSGEAEAAPLKLSLETHNPFGGDDTGSTSPSSMMMVPPAPSPLTTRLHNAAIVRRTSKDFSFGGASAAAAAAVGIAVGDAASPSVALRKALTDGDHKHSQDSVLSLGSGSGSGSGSGATPTMGGGSGGGGGGAIMAGLSPTIREADEDDENVLLAHAQSAHDVINAIRLEHLERVLDRIARKLGGGGKGRSKTGSNDDDDEDDDDGYDDTEDHDLADVRPHWDGDDEEDNDNINNRNVPEERALLGEHGSVDSMDRLLQYKTEDNGANGVDADVDRQRAPSSPPALQLPNRFRAKKDVAAADDEAVSAGAGELVAAEAKESGNAREEQKNGHKDSGGDFDDDAKEYKDNSGDDVQMQGGDSREGYSLGVDAKHQPDSPFFVHHHHLLPAVAAAAAPFHEDKVATSEGGIASQLPLNHAHSILKVSFLYLCHLVFAMYTLCK